MSVSNFTELDQLQPPGVVDDHYMLLPIERGFDWKTCFANVSAGEWYLVAFRSKHRQEVDKTFLYWLDHKATLAAQQTPGFLYYFTGVPLASGECLSFCLWASRSAAVQGAAHRAHREAVETGLAHYEYYCLERYLIDKQGDQLTFTTVP
jgi:hypothetical protein